MKKSKIFWSYRTWFNRGRKELKEVIKINFAVGDYVKVLKGGFADQEGKVAEIDMEHKKAKVMIEMFGRMTPVEVDFDSVQKAN